MAIARDQILHYVDAKIIEHYEMLRNRRFPVPHNKLNESERFLMALLAEIRATAAAEGIDSITGLPLAQDDAADVVGVEPATTASNVAAHHVASTPTPSPEAVEKATAALTTATETIAAQSAPTVQERPTGPAARSNPANQGGQQGHDRRHDQPRVGGNR